VLTGTAAIDVLEPALDLDQPLDLAMFNAAFQPARTDFDWLSRDETIVDAYIADPYCGFGIDPGSTKLMFLGARRVADPAQVAAMRSGLPLYVAVGEADPVNGGLALLTPLTDLYAAAGLTDVTVRTYPGARHEMLNETNRDEIIGELLSWIDRVLAAVTHPTTRTLNYGSCRADHPGSSGRRRPRRSSARRRRRRCAPRIRPRPS